MSRRNKAHASPVIHADVLRKIRQHARNHSKTEVCGVLVGHEDGGCVEIEAGIPGINAEQAGAHVTFTQDTWEHIYKIKDRDYPDKRIVGWYHSHPGFGIFLSDHDTFIHKNFFSSPAQIAWVYDPHSEEEGCFGWVNGHIERLARVSVTDCHGGEAAEPISRTEPVVASVQAQEKVPVISGYPLINDDDGPGSEASLQRVAMTVASYLLVLALGFAISWYFFPRVALVGVPVDPVSGRVLVDPGKAGVDLDSIVPFDKSSAQQGTASESNAKPDAANSKEQHERRR
jgi:proteasome lid subunit RPN8/RPN11